RSYSSISHATKLEDTGSVENDSESAEEDLGSAEEEGPASSNNTANNSEPGGSTGEAVNPFHTIVVPSVNESSAGRSLSGVEPLPPRRRKRPVAPKPEDFNVGYEPATYNAPVFEEGVVEGNEEEEVHHAKTLSETDETTSPCPGGLQRCVLKTNVSCLGKRTRLFVRFSTRFSGVVSSLDSSRVVYKGDGRSYSSISHATKLEDTGSVENDSESAEEDLGSAEEEEPASSNNTANISEPGGSTGEAVNPFHTIVVPSVNESSAGRSLSGGEPLPPRGRKRPVAPKPEDFNVGYEPATYNAPVFEEGVVEGNEEEEVHHAKTLSETDETTSPCPGGLQRCVLKTNVSCLGKRTRLFVRFSTRFSGVVSSLDSSRVVYKGDGLHNAMVLSLLERDLNLRLQWDAANPSTDDTTLVIACPESQESSSSKVSHPFGTASHNPPPAVKPEFQAPHRPLPHHQRRRSQHLTPHHQPEPAPPRQPGHLPHHQPEPAIYRLINQAICHIINRSLFNQAISRLINQAISRLINQAICHIISRSLFHLINQAISRLINQAICHIISRSLFHLINQAISRLIIQAIYRLINQAICHIINQAICHIINRSLFHSSTKPSPASSTRPSTASSTRPSATSSTRTCATSPGAFATSPTRAKSSARPCSTSSPRACASEVPVRFCSTAAILPARSSPPPRAKAVQASSPATVQPCSRNTDLSDNHWNRLTRDISSGLHDLWLSEGEKRSSRRDAELFPSGGVPSVVGHCESDSVAFVVHPRGVVKGEGGEDDEPLIMIGDEGTKCFKSSFVSPNTKLTIRMHNLKENCGDSRQFPVRVACSANPDVIIDQSILVCDGEQARAVQKTLLDQPHGDEVVESEPKDIGVKKHVPNSSAPVSQSTLDRAAEAQSTSEATSRSVTGKETTKAVGPPPTESERDDQGNHALRSLPSQPLVVLITVLFCWSRIQS
ncbi:unnamed protein product, partial [Cyprideis torosa]